MKTIFKHQVFRASLSCLFLMGLFWTNVATHLVQMIDENASLIEICIPMDVDSEGEEKNGENDKDNKVRLDFVFSNLHKIISNREINTSFIYGSNFQPEIPTPPPEFLFIFA